MIPIFDNVSWQMTSGERAALEGLLSQVQPKLAIEIGTAEGGSLRCLARHSGRVLSFDLAPPPFDIGELPNVTLHTGDSHELLPRALRELAAQGLNVDFVLVDGDHTADGVERDVRDLLTSEAIRSTAIVFHDTMNDSVRAGLERITSVSEPKIAYFDLDFVSGRLNYGGPFHHELWGGLGVMIVDANDGRTDLAPATHRGAYSTFDLVSPMRDALVDREQSGAPVAPWEARAALRADSSAASALAGMRAAVVESQRRLDEIRNSKSWRMTAPIRTAGRVVRLRRS